MENSHKIVSELVKDFKENEQAFLSPLPMEFLNAQQGVDLRVYIRSQSVPKAANAIEEEDNNKAENIWNAILTI